MPRGTPSLHRVPDTVPVILTATLEVAVTLSHFTDEDTEAQEGTTSKQQSQDVDLGRTAPGHLTSVPRCLSGSLGPQLWCRVLA